MNVTSFSELAHILYLKSEYEIILDDGKFHTPRNKKTLDKETANWVINKIKIFNENNPKTQQIIDICNDYIISTEKMNDVYIIVEDELY